MQTVNKFKPGIYWNDREQSIEVGWLMIQGQAGRDQVVDGECSRAQSRATR